MISKYDPPPFVSRSLPTFSKPFIVTKRSNHQQNASIPANQSAVSLITETRRLVLVIA